MTTLRITHTAADGTLVNGTSRGDGAAPILKEHQFRWSNTIGQWYRPNSRDRAPRTHAIEVLATALRDAGFTVEIEIDETLRPVAEVEADRAARSEDRADALADKAGRQEAAAQATWDRATDMANRIPFGQPILVGHHSERRDRRFRDRIHTLHERAAAGYTEAADTARRAAAAASTGARYNPTTVRNRIANLEADLRRTRRSLDGYERNFRNGRGEVYQTEKHAPATGEYRARLEADATRLEEEIAYWRQVAADQVASGQAGYFGPHNVHAGMYVLVRGHWYRVVRANSKSATVQKRWPNEVTELSWSDTTPWQEIKDARTGDKMRAVGELIPYECAKPKKAGDAPVDVTFACGAEDKVPAWWWDRNAADPQAVARCGACRTLEPLAVPPASPTKARTVHGG